MHTGTMLLQEFYLRFNCFGLRGGLPPSKNLLLYYKSKLASHTDMWNMTLTVK